MNRLYLLGFTNDLAGVVFSRRKGGKTASFWVPVDRSFLDAITKLDRARRRRDGEPEAMGPILQLPDELEVEIAEPQPRAPAPERRPPPPRRAPLPAIGRSEMGAAIPASEIQKLVREGKSVESVAKTAKASRAWVERLAEPVFAERTGIVRLAQRAYMPRARLGRSGVPLAQAVAQNLLERRATAATIEALDEGWDARATKSGVWRVRLRFTHRGSRRTAEWDFVKSTRQITPRNKTAAELGWRPAPPEPKRPKAAAPPVVTDDPPEPAQPADGEAPAPRRAKRSSARRAPARKKAARRSKPRRASRGRRRGR